MKKLSLISILILLTALAFHSCKEKDEIINDGDDKVNRPTPNPTIITEDYGRAKVLGFVKDKAGQPLAGVKVFFGEKSTTSDGDGKFELKDVSEGSNKRIWFEKDGFASTQKLITTIEYLPNRVDATLFPIARIETMSQDGGIIDEDNFYLEIPKNAFVYVSDGKEVSGDVKVEATPFLTTDKEFFSAFPGRFEGKREDGTITPIESFGFIDVNLSADGEKVQLKDGTSAIIKIKAPANAPATIPMWHYDEVKAEWIEDGVGTLNNGFYTAEVSHFTKWNWDKPNFYSTKIKGRVVDNENISLEGATLIITGITYKFQNIIKTNASGEYELDLPNDCEFKIEAQFEFYGSTILTETSPSGKGQTKNLNDIIIDINFNKILNPTFDSDTLYIINNETATIKGKYFGSEKKSNYKLLFNGKEIKTSSWDNLIIEFIVPSDTPTIGNIQIDRAGMKSKVIFYKISIPKTTYPLLYISKNRNIIIRGQNFGSEKKSNYKLLLNGSEVTISSWENTLIDFIVPSNTPQKGTIQVDRAGVKSELILYEEGEWTCTIFAASENSLDDDFELFCDVNTRSVVLDGYCFRYISGCIGNLKGLTYFSLVHNCLEELTSNIGNLKRLNSLHLYGNHLKTLPTNIGNLASLKELLLGGNQLTSLPESIGDLQKLTDLSLGGNKLTRLPESIKNLKNSLKTLHLTGNYFSAEEKAKVELWLPNTNIVW